ncbi:hypothetical protein N3K66_000978 [Trichothecium roseum]|uniref:Uncharacterized protein n=1 Tax=Trichothecium roseum TaxID=47278 RepID=A0ACC0VDH1_9HYPO|nr:hypothetical protein N3K66_000978 [Trichothecium roseum]
MQITTVLTTLGLAAAALSQPYAPISRRDGIQVAHLTFHGGPASYSLIIPSDGQVFYTNSDAAINIIDAPDYNALSQCEFKTDGDRALVLSIGDDGVQRIVVGPPQPIRSVSCKGTCVAIYGDCFKDGQSVGPCCNGFCAANKCRPWNVNTN